MARRTAISLLCIVACRDLPQPPYVRLEGTSPRIEDAPPARAHLVVFWASWCAPCQKETPQLRALAADPPEGLAIVVFSHDEDMNGVHRFFAGTPDPSLHLRLDPGHSVAESFGVDTLPTSVLVDEGRLVARFSGPREWDAPAMRRLLRKLVPER